MSLSGSSLSILVAIKSAVRYELRRNAIRLTWGKVAYFEGVRILVVFITGRAKNSTEQHDLERENENYGDIVQFDGIDDYM